MNPEIESRIRSLAHQFWEEEGRPEGKEQEHWRRACERVDGGGGSDQQGAQSAREESQTGAQGLDGDPDGSQSGMTKEDVFLKSATRRTPD